MKRFKKLTLVILAVLVVLGFLFTKPAKVTFSTLFFIPQVFPQFPVKPLEWVSSEPIVEKVEFFSNGKKVKGEIVRPNDNKKHPALIIAMGVRTAEGDKPIMANFAKALARIGFVTVFANLEDLQALKVRIEEKETFISTFKYLENLPYVDKNKISFVGISVGSSIALRAAQDRQISEKVKAVVFFGGYFDAVNYFSSVVTKKVFWQGQEFDWQPKEGTARHLKEVVINLLPVEEQAILTKVFIEGQKLQGEDFAKLSANSQLAIRIFEADNREKFASFWSQVPKDLRLQFEDISPAPGIKNTKTQLFILHDKGDQAVSYFESRKLAENLPKEVKKNHLEISLFEHVQPKKGFSLAIILELLKLYQFIWQAVFFIS